MINSEKIANLKNLEKELKKDYIIHSNVIIGNKFIPYLNSDYKNSISVMGAMQINYRYKSIDLLNECSNFGKKLFNLYKDGFELYRPNYYIDDNNEKVEFISLCQKEFPYIKNDKPKELISMFIEWFEQYGSSIHPKIVGISEDTIIEFRDIIELRNKFILLYLLYTFYYNVSLVCNTFIDNGDFDNRLDNISETTLYSLHSSIKIINTIGNILFDNFSNLNNSFVELSDTEKIKYNEKIKKELTQKVNYYSNIFKINVTSYIIYDNKKCISSYISDNLFDLAWNIFLETFKLSKEMSKTKICTECGDAYTPTGNYSIRCNTCNEQYNADKKSKNEKFMNINYIIEHSRNFISKNKNLQKRIDEIVTLNDKGNSKKKDTYSKKIIDKTKKELDEELKKCNYLHKNNCYF